MPIFEYQCRDCGNRFEKLVLKPATEKVACPKCGKRKLEQLISSFLAPVEGRYQPKPVPHPEYPDGYTSTKHDDD